MYWEQNNDSFGKISFIYLSDTYNSND